jgi:Lactonase, 7-bladed beta-propeller
MAQQRRPRLRQGSPLAVVAFILASSADAMAQAQQQFVYGSVPVTSSSSEVAAFAKNGSTGALSTLAASPFPDKLEGGALAIDALGRFVFIINPSTSNISMFQIDQTSGNLAEVAGSPFATGPTENPQMAPKSPNCLATEASGQFLYVGYRFGNFSGGGAVNEYLIDATNLQLIPLPGQPTTDIPSSPIAIATDAKGLHLYVGLGENASTGMQDAGTQVYSIDSVTGELSPVGSAGNALTNGKSMALDRKNRFFFDGWGSTQGVIDSALISPADGTAISGISSITLPANVFPSAMLAESSGNFLYVQENASAVAYSINQTSGALMQTSASAGVFSFLPGTAAADPLGPYLYSLQPDGIHGFLIDPATGSLSEVAGSPFLITPATQGTLAISGAPAQAVSGPVAVLFPASEDFGQVTLGQTSNSQTVTLTNTGGQGLDLNSISIGGANPSDFTVTANCTTPIVLAENVSCSINVAFMPTAAGPRQASLLATDNAPGNPQSIPLSGIGVAPQPAVTLIPGSLTFPTTNQGSTSGAQTVSVANSGTATLHVASVLLSGTNPGDFNLMNGCSGAYGVNATCTITVSFSPQGAGQRLASIVIADDAPDSPQSIQLSGSGGAAPATKPVVTLSTNAISFGAITQGTSAAPQSIQLTNSGTGTLHIASVQLGGTNAADITLTNGCSAGAYAANTTCTIGVAFSPITIGQRFASITITDDAPDSPQVISVTANANPALTIASASSGGTTVTISAGQTASFNFVLTPGAGFIGSASFTCTGAPAAATCMAPTVQLTSAASLPYTISVSTTGSGLLTRRMPRASPGRGTVLYLCAIFFVVAMLFRLVLCSTRAQRPHHLCMARCGWAAGVVLVIGMYSSGCGGGSISVVNAQSTPQVITPAGTSMLTVTPVVTASSGKQLPMQPIQLTLIVN